MNRVRALITDKPIARGDISSRAVWIAACCALAASLAMTAAIGAATAAVLVVIIVLFASGTEALT